MAHLGGGRDARGSGAGGHRAGASGVRAGARRPAAGESGRASESGRANRWGSDRGSWRGRAPGGDGRWLIRSGGRRWAGEAEVLRSPTAASWHHSVAGRCHHGRSVVTGWTRSGRATEGESRRLRPGRCRTATISGVGRHRMVRAAARASTRGVPRSAPAPRRARGSAGCAPATAAAAERTQPMVSGRVVPSGCPWPARWHRGKPPPYSGRPR